MSDGYTPYFPNCSLCGSHGALQILTLLNRSNSYFGSSNHQNMKKIFVLASLFFALFTVSASAQGGPGGGGMTPEQRAERQKQMKADLVAKAKITEAEAEKVMQIQQESRQGMRGLRDLSDEDRQKKLDEIKAENLKKFKAIPLTDDQVKAVDAFYEEQMKKMMNRGGGNGEKKEGGN